MSSRLTIAAVFVFAVTCLACAGGRVQNHTNGTAAIKEYTRQEFEKAVIGKSPQEVIKTIGKPSDTRPGSKNHEHPESPGFDGTFDYTDQELSVIDSTTGKVCSNVHLHFRNSVVDSVNY